MLNKRQMQAVATRKLILEVSKSLIVKYGYNAVSISQICKECKVAKGTFYIYFSSKTEIVKEILKDITNEMWEVFSSTKYRNASEMIYNYHKIFMNQIIDNGLQFTREFLIIIISEAINSRNSLNDHKIKIIEIINSGIKTGEFRNELNVDEVANEYILAIYSILIDWCTREKNEIVLKSSMEWIESYINKLK